MTVKSLAEVVNVSAEAQTLNTTDASLGGSMDNALIQALPSETRNVPDLLSLEPGVLYLPTLGASEANPGGDSRSGAVNGIRSDQGNVTIDGVDDNDQVFGYAFTGVLRETQDSVEEFRVATSNTNSDEGRSAGAQVSLITKSGTNKFHGARLRIQPSHVHRLERLVREAGAAERGTLVATPSTKQLGDD